MGDLEALNGVFVGALELVLMVVLGGAFVFAADLCRQITIDCRIDFLRVASYGAGTESVGTIRLVQPPYFYADLYWVAKIRCFFLNTEKSSIKKGKIGRAHV